MTYSLTRITYKSDHYVEILQTIKNVITAETETTDETLSLSEIFYIAVMASPTLYNTKVIFLDIRLHITL